MTPQLFAQVDRHIVKESWQGEKRGIYTGFVFFELQVMSGHYNLLQKMFSLSAVVLCR